jgi:hypothetical protein
VIHRTLFISLSTQARNDTETGASTARTNNRRHFFSDPAYFLRRTSTISATWVSSAHQSSALADELAFISATGGDDRRMDSIHATLTSPPALYDN